MSKSDKKRDEKRDEKRAKKAKKHASGGKGAKKAKEAKKAKASSPGGEKLRTLSDIRRYFYRNERPIYFISATNFNLLGMDEWVRGFKHLCYIDCFDGRHPNLFTPSERPHSTFQGIEDINNYLLEHKEVMDLIQKRGPGQAVFLMFDARTEELAKELGLEVCFPPASLRQEVDNKITGTRIGERAGVASVPNVLGKVDGWASLRALSAGLGDDLVVQTAFGDSGHTTFFISTEADFDKHAAEIIREPEVKVMRRIRCRGAAIEGCVTRHGTIVGPLMTELVGFPELTPYRGGWCGNEVFAGAFTEKIRKNARRSTFKFGEELRRMGYRGYFELDFLTDLDSGEVYLGEINPRITGASQMTNLASFAHADLPLFLFHLLEWQGVDYELDVEALNERWSRAENIDTWSQLVLKHTGADVDVVTHAPASGIWRLQGGSSSGDGVPPVRGGLELVRPEHHRRAVEDESQAFFMRITREGDYRYEGADLGILVTRGRLMDDEHRLTPRARRFIDGIRAQYEGRPLGEAPSKKSAPPAETGRFKLL